MMMGKPITAINAVDCWARAAIAAKKVNTRLILPPPKQVISIKSPRCSKGLPSSSVNSSRDSKLMHTIKNRLNSNFESTKSRAPAME